MPMTIRAEQLGYWYLRLNGFLTIPNFIVHPEHGSNQGTDVDVLAVRFPFRAELKRMKDDDHFSCESKRPFIAFAEIKAPTCNLNGPWTDPNRQNMQRVLRAIGAFPEETTNVAAKALYDHGVYETELYYVSFICLGQTSNQHIATMYPQVLQVTWPQVLKFIYNRFQEFQNEKVAHPQWDQQGHDLWDHWERNEGNEAAFVSGVAVTP